MKGYIDKEASDVIRKKIDAILHKTHFKHPVVADILELEQTTYKSYRSKGVLEQEHLDKVVVWFKKYHEAMWIVNKTK